jgi:hypothetical protein
MSFEQAALRVEKEEEFEELKSAIERGLAPEKVEKFLKQVGTKALRVRNLEAVLAKRVLERVDETLAQSGKSGQSLYGSLTLSDQGQMREFYLSKVEEVTPKLRAKFQKIYRYY